MQDWYDDELSLSMRSFVGLCFGQLFIVFVQSFACEDCLVQTYWGAEPNFGHRAKVEFPDFFGLCCGESALIGRERSGWAWRRS